MEKGYNAVMKNNHVWKNAEKESPQYKPDTWSDEMICITNLGNVYKLTFMGAWQRPALFKLGETVEWWIENPQTQST